MVALPNDAWAVGDGDDNNYLTQGTRVSSRDAALHRETSHYDGRSGQREGWQHWKGRGWTRTVGCSLSLILTI